MPISITAVTVTVIAHQSLITRSSVPVLGHRRPALTVAQPEGTAVAGAGATAMRNQNGVVVHLFTTTEGLNLKLAPEGIRLYFK